jgi:hypothetical protein
MRSWLEVCVRSYSTRELLQGPLRWASCYRVTALAIVLRNNQLDNGGVVGVTRHPYRSNVTTSKYESFAARVCGALFPSTVRSSHLDIEVAGSAAGVLYVWF